MTHAEMDMESNTSAYIRRVDVEFVHVVLTVRETGGESETSDVRRGPRHANKVHSMR